MAYREVARVEIKEVLRRWQGGAGQRALARQTGLSRVTVRKYVAAAEGLGLRRGGPPPTEAELLALQRPGPREAEAPSEAALARWSGQIERWLVGERLQLTRVLELLEGRGCAVSYSSLRRFVARHGLGKTAATTVRMAGAEPGAVAEADFGRLGRALDPETGRERVVWALVIVLAYSRHTFVWPLFRQTLEEVVAGLEAAWAFFGGVPRSLVLDNFPAAVAGPDPLAPRLTRGFLEYSQHRGFLADPARPAHPKDKPHVERGIPYVRERFFKGGTFHGLTDLRQQARAWCLEVAGRRVHGTTRRLPLVVFREEEQARLLPWDGEIYAVPVLRAVKVHPDHHVAFDHALYSAPAASCPPGAELELRADPKLVRLYRRGQLVKVHPRVPRGGRSTDPADYPPERATYALRDPGRALADAAALGPAVGEFAGRLLAGPGGWAKLRRAAKLLRLGERYTAARLEAACARALAVDLLDVRRLEHILAEALEAEAAPPEPLTEAPPPGRFARPGSAFAPAAVAAAGEAGAESAGASA